MEEQVKQVFYRAMVDVKYGKEGFSQVPVSEEYFGNNLGLAKYIISYYRVHDSELSGNELKLLISTDLKEQHKYTDEVYLGYAQDVNDVAHLHVQDNYSSSKLIETETSKWLSQQLMIKRIKKYIANMDNEPEKLDQLADDISDIAHVTTNNDLGETLSLYNVEDEERRLDFADEAYADVVSTGWSNLDEVTDGGLAPGEMGMFIAPSGTGKTTILMNIATNYSRMGKSVLYFALEERMARMENKLLSMLTDKNRHYYYDDDPNGRPVLNRERLLEMSKRMEAGLENKSVGDVRLWIKEPYQLSPKDIEKVLTEVLHKDGKYPDVVILDYPELLDNTFERGNTNEFTAMGKLYHELRAIANRYHVILWVVSQTNRDAYGSEIKTARAIEGSKQKINSVEFCATLNQLPEEFSAGFMRLYVDKSRNRPTVNVDTPELNSMLKLRVDTSSVRITVETQEESDAHDNLLRSLNTKGTKPQAYSKTNQELEDLRNNIPDDLQI